MSKVIKSLITLTMVFVMLLIAMPKANAYEIIRDPEQSFIDMDEDLVIKKDNPINTTENPMIEAKELIIDGISYGMYTSESEISSSILSIANRYLDDEINENIKLLNDVEIKEVLSVLSTINQKKDLINSLLDKDNLQEFQVEVKKDDKVEDILKKYLIDKQDLLDANENLDMYIDETDIEDQVTEVFNEDLTLNLYLPTPKISIEISHEIKRDVEVANVTEYQDSSSVYIGEEKVSVEGKKGLNNETVKLSSINGKENPEEIIETKVIEQPVNRVVLKGTKEKGSALGYFIRPTTGYISSPFGYRSRGFHGGIDIANSYGTSILAADGGVVTETGWDGTYGMKVKIDHRNGYKTIYAHLSSIDVNVGDKVNQGQLIARMGSTGNSTGNHLHFEIRVNDQRVNPSNYVDF